jgi:hypothetical protein
MSASRDQYVQRLIQRFVFLRFGSSHLFLSSGLTFHTNFLTGSGNQQTELRQAENEVTMASQKRDEMVKAVTDDVGKLASNVGEIATTEAEVESTLMRVKGPPAPKPVPDQPTGLELTMGDDDGELSGQCDGQPGIVDHYEIQFTTVDPNGASPNWQHADTSKKSRFDLSGLPSGEKVWVRLRACNARGKSNWSDPACKRVP